MRRILALIAVAAVLSSGAVHFLSGEHQENHLARDEGLPEDVETAEFSQGFRAIEPELAGPRKAFSKDQSELFEAQRARKAPDDEQFYFERMAAYDSIAAMVDDVGVAAVLSKPEFASDVWLIADLCASLSEMPAGIEASQVQFCDGYQSVLGRFDQGEFDVEISLGLLGDQAAGIREAQSASAAVEFLLSEIRSARSMIHTVSAATNLALLYQADGSEVLENLPPGTFQEHQLAANAAARLYYCNRYGGCSSEHPITQMFCAMFGCEEFVGSLDVAIRRTQSQRELDIMDAYLAMFYRGG